MDKIQKLFKKAKEHGDEKVNIAIQTYEMVDKHIRRLDSDLAKFESEMKVEEQIWTYTFMSYIAENGGFVGLFLGYSVLSIGEGFWKALKWFCEPKASIYQ